MSKKSMKSKPASGTTPGVKKYRKAEKKLVKKVKGPGPR